MNLGNLASLLDDPLFKQIGSRPGILLLDYDGTLAPFHTVRSQAYPYAGVRQLLAKIPTEGPGRFVIASGRNYQEIIPLLDIKPVPEIWGDHGAQRLTIKGNLIANSLPDKIEDTLKLAARALGALGVMPEDIEQKTASLALHVRSYDDPQQAERLIAQTKELWQILAEPAGLALLEFEKGVELRAPQFNKGLVVNTMAKENPDAILVYLGDDNTDEDAFSALPAEGIGILVSPQTRPTAARFWLYPPDDLKLFLAHWSAIKFNEG